MLEQGRDGGVERVELVVALVVAVVVLLALPIGRRRLDRLHLISNLIVHLRGCNRYGANKTFNSSFNRTFLSTNRLKHFSLHGQRYPAAEPHQFNKQ